MLRGERGTGGRARAVVTVVALAGSCAMAVAAAPLAAAVGSGVAQASVVSAVPSAATPNVTDGVVYAISQVGSQMVIGGSFDSVENPKSTTVLTRTRVLAFDATTGTVSTGFAPNLDGTVQAVTPGPAANTVFVGGAFNNVNGVKSKGIALLNTTTGLAVAGFKVPTLNGIVYSTALVGNRLYLAGSFTKANGVAHAGLLAINATTGAVDPFMSIQLAGHHNYKGSGGANGAVGPRAIAVNPAGTRAMVIGNFTTADGLPRDQIAMLDLDGTQAAVDPNWNTGQFTAACFSSAFDTYVTDVQYSPDGSYFIVTATGGSGTNKDGSRSLCDSASRWESTTQGPDVHPTWVDYTGQDSLWATAVSGSAVYVSGHERWLNNDNGYDHAGAGAVPRPGVAALDPVSGVPLTWNPGRNPRGAGAYALFLNQSGLYVGSDTAYIGNRKYKRERVAYFPLKGGVAPASTTTAQLPANVYLAGPLGGTAANVLYRVDAGGPAIAATDGGPAWAADTTSSDPGAQLHNAGSSSASYSCCATLSGTVPSTTPVSLFNTERWDPGSKGDGAEMHWSFPVPAGTDVAVRLYFANRYSGTSAVGQRVFDVAVDGSTVLPNYDIVADVGNNVATMKSFTVTSPGAITVDFTHEVQEPLIDGIELINLDAPSGSSTVNPDDLDYRSVNGSQIGDLTVVPNTGVTWGSTRGAFMVGNYLYFPTTGGTFDRATFDGSTLGTPQSVDPYDDPTWSNVKTGSGQTYQSIKPSYYSEMGQITGQFYSAGRIYYTLAGQSSLYWRWFSPDSGIVGAAEHSTPAPGLANVEGMTLSGSTIYYASATDGSLHSVGFANGAPTGTDTIVDATNDWRARSLFLHA